jgi:hypothetical protein
VLGSSLRETSWAESRFGSEAPPQGDCGSGRPRSAGAELGGGACWPSARPGADGGSSKPPQAMTDNNARRPAPVVAVITGKPLPFGL